MKKLYNTQTVKLRYSYTLFFFLREEEEMKESEIKQKEMEKQAIFDALPSWKKRLILEKRS